MYFNAMALRSKTHRRLTMIIMTSIYRYIDISANDSIIIEGSLEAKLPTVWTHVKHRWEESEQSRGEERRSERRKSEKKEDAGAREKVEKSRFTAFLQWCVAPEGRKVGSLKGRARSPGQMRYEKLHAVVARSPFPSQNAENTPCLDHFWTLRWRKSARRCGSKHISKLKCTKPLRVGTLLEVKMSKKWTPLWRKAHCEVKLYKTHQVRSTFWSWDVEKACAVVARSTFPSQKC